jgi:hypothetical protein
MQLRPFFLKFTTLGYYEDLSDWFLWRSGISLLTLTETNSAVTVKSKKNVPTDVHYTSRTVGSKCLLVWGNFY